MTIRDYPRVRDLQGGRKWLTKEYTPRVEYHRGFLMVDRVGNWELDQLAKAMMRAAENNLVKLFQIKLGDGDYVYIAERTRAAGFF